MTVQEIIESVRASFEMEGFLMTTDDRKRGESILSGRKSIEEVIRELKDKVQHGVVHERQSL